MTLEEQRIKERYDVIKAYADSGAKVLPDEFKATVEDARYFELMTAHTFNRRRSVYSAADEAAFDRRYYTMYLSAKRGEDRAAQQAQRILRAGLQLHDSRTYLMNPLQTASSKEILRHLFTMLWVYSGEEMPVSAQKIYENAVPALLGSVTAAEAKAQFLAANHLKWKEVMGDVEQRLLVRAADGDAAAENDADGEERLLVLDRSAAG